MNKVSLFILLFFFISCKKFNFNEFEREMMTVYNVGDTLVFQSVKTGNIESFVIMRKVNESSHYYQDEPRKHHGDIGYRNLKKPIITDDHERYPDLFIIANGKYHNGIHVSFEDFYVWFENDLGVLNNRDTLKCLDKTFINYYILNNTDDRYTISKIIWQKQYGIVKYDYRNGDSYVRTNIP